MGKIVSVHQPNFFPWLGFFDKLVRADLFIYLDHVENNPRDPLWLKRVKILLGNAEYWLTIPLVRPKGSVVLAIKEIKISPNTSFSVKHLKSIELSYKKAPFFEDIFPLVRFFYEAPSFSVANRNIDLIETICGNLDINTHRIRSSNYLWNNQATDLLIEMLQKFNGTTYLSGDGSSGYIDEMAFKKNDIKLIYQNFQHPIYPQVSNQEFIAGLSIIDALMNLGFEGVKKILNIESDA